MPEPSLPRQQKKKEFRQQIHIILLTLGTAPYLLAVYAFNSIGLSLTQSLAFLAIVALLFHLLGFYMLRRFSNQLLRLVGDIETSINAHHRKPIQPASDFTTELHALTINFNTLIDELEEQKKQHHEVAMELIKLARHDIESYQQKLANSEMLHSYVSSNVIEQIRKQGGKGILSNQTRLVTVLFADIRGFTAMSEHMTPDEIIPMLNEYFDAMVTVIHNHHGIVDKFIGDAIMAVFGLTTPKKRSTLDAVHAAIGMQEEMKTLTRKREVAGRPTFSIGIGLNTGEVIVGNIGSHNRKDYTVIGDTVNVASRLQSLAKNNEIIASAATHHRCRSDIPMQAIGSVELKNRHKPIVCYKVPNRQIIQQLLAKRTAMAKDEFDMEPINASPDERTIWQRPNTDQP